MTTVVLVLLRNYDIFCSVAPLFDPQRRATLQKQTSQIAGIFLAKEAYSTVPRIRKITCSVLKLVITAMVFVNGPFT